MEEIKTVIDNTKDWYDLIDTALKIGLGALIAGSFTYLTTRTNHSHENKKIQYELKKSLFLEANELSIKYFSKIYTLFNVWGSDFVENKKISNLPLEWKKLYSEDNIIYNSRRNDLEKIGANLSLLGLSEVYEKLLRYDFIILSYRNEISNENKNFPSKKEFQELMIEPNKLKKEFNKSLQDYFNKLTIN